MKRISLSIFFIFTVLSVAYGQQNLIYTHADELLFQGKELFAERKYAASFRYFEEFLKTANEAGQIIEADYYLAANAYYMQSDEADTRLEMHTEKYPNTPFVSETNFMRGMIAYSEKRYSHALNFFKNVDENLLSTHEQSDLLLYKGYTLVEAKNYALANRTFARLKEMDTRYNTAATYYYAYTEYLLAHYDTALAEFQTIVDVPQYANIVPYYLAQIYYKQKDYAKVREFSQTLLKNNPDNLNNAEIYRILGEIAFEEKNYTAAISNLKNYERIFPKTLRNDVYLLGLSYLYTGDYKNSVQYLSKVTTAKDTLTENAYFYLGNAYVKLDDKNNARMAYQSALATNFNPAVREEAMYNYAMTSYETTTLFGESVKAFEQLLNEYPKSKHADDAYNYLSSIYLSTNDYQAALNSINKIQRPNAQMLESKQYLFYRLGILLHNQNKMRDAINNFTQAIDVAKDGKYLSEALFWRADSYQKTAKFADAVNDLKTFFANKNATESKNYILANYNLGYAYFSQKNYTQAKDWFLKYTNTVKDKKSDVYADALNRVGDCYFAERNFSKANETYTKSVAANLKNADYAMFQSGYVLGLQKNYDGKIAKMNSLVKQFPESEYAPQAMFETGRAYIMKENDKQAISTYNRLITIYPNSAMARKASLEIGMVYGNEGNTEEAITAYKSVISKHTGSEEAYAALDALEAIYIDRNEVSSYLAYTNTLGKMANRTANYADSISYIAAERRYLNQDYKNVIPSLNSYVTSYCPGGRECIDATYYLADSYYQTGDKINALKTFKNLLESGVNQYAEIATMRCAEITYEGKDYQQSLEFFKKLQILAQTANNKSAARLGVLRCSYLINDYQSTISTANDILGDDATDPNLKIEARYNRAKASLALNQKDKAIEDLTALGKNTQIESGAEANYLLANLYFEQKKYTQSEKIILDLTEKGTPYPYWLARCMVLLADLSIVQNDDFQAKQYLLSLQKNYTEQNDVQTMITDRLDAISKREN
ncbi:MAG: tetratricopeptide repeat protein [Prevotellaceae bacterium]|jgi:TolA-binding protein|nr:tetratricopeptide repeat protein [Prevotellaceae bacterium]